MPVINNQLSKVLLTWYDREGRDLPWRVKGGRLADPYSVWLSEIMLQQTTVVTVKPYFNRFLDLWPRIEQLAHAPVEDIMKEWAGLGYYARARNLHRCAQVITNDYKGHFPTTEEGLLKLPGIGPYTAAAVAAIAFNQPSAVVDGNIERVFSRLMADRTPLPALKEKVRQAVKSHVPLQRPGDFAQALMDLGATVCTPRNPKCLLCPVKDFCHARVEGIASELPVKAPKKTKPTRRALAFWITQTNKVLLQRRPPKGLLGGMPGLLHTPWIEQTDFPVFSTEQALHEIVSLHHPQSEKRPCERTEGDAPAIRITDFSLSRPPKTALHTFTHFHLESQVYAIALSKEIIVGKADYYWHPVKDIKTAGLPTVFSKMAALWL